MAITSKATKKVVAMRFGILSPEEVTAMSVAAVTTNDIVDRQR